MKEAFRALTKDDILQPSISNHDFGSANVRADDVGYNIYVFQLQYQQIFAASQPLKVEFKSDVIVPIDINGYALVLTNRLLSVSSDGQKHFDVI